MKVEVGTCPDSYESNGEDQLDPYDAAVPNDASGNLRVREYCDEGPNSIAGNGKYGNYINGLGWATADYPDALSD